MKKLKKLVSEFVSINPCSQNRVEVYNRVIANVHSITNEILLLEKSRNKASIREVLYPLREVYLRSPFTQRLENWPRGYQGDFETIEYLYNGINKSKPNTLEFFVEEYALRSAIAQQHRNKVDFQSMAILDTVRKKRPSCRILIVGCGSGLDIRRVEAMIQNYDCEIVLNDMDEKALEYTLSHLSSQKIVVPVHANIIDYIRGLDRASAKFDLVMFGGVFDYLSDKQIKFVLSNIYSKHLKNEGRIIWTNIAKGNPYRCWIEYCANWTLIERTEEKCCLLSLQSGIDKKEISIKRDFTNLTYLVDINKTSPKIINEFRKYDKLTLAV